MKGFNMTNALIRTGDALRFEAKAIHMKYIYSNKPMEPDEIERLVAIEKELRDVNKRLETYQPAKDEEKV